MEHISDLLPPSLQCALAEGQVPILLNPDRPADFFPSPESLAPNKSAETPRPATGSRAVPFKRTSVEILKRRTDEALSRAGSDSQQILQLGFREWDDDRRGVPNPLIRGGLFTTRVSSKRVALKSEKIASLSNSVILYTGEELRQDDLTVWMSIVNLGRGQPLGEPIYFTGYKLIKDMKWRMHMESYKRLRGCIDRLKVTSIKITLKDERSGYAGSLIRDYMFDGVDKSGRDSFVVRLEPTIANLFLYDNTTLIEWEQRRQIGTKASLTLWLHTFYSSHRDPIPYAVAKLRELCKSEEKNLSNFRGRLRNSMETLVGIGLLNSYCITSDVVHVKRANLDRLCA